MPANVPATVNYDDSPINTGSYATGPFQQYLINPQYQSYLNPLGPNSEDKVQAWQGATSGAGAMAHYLSQFINGVRTARLQGEIKQSQQEVQDQQVMDNAFKAAQDRGVSPERLTALRNKIDQAHVGWHLDDANNPNSLAAHAKSNPAVKAMHTIATSIFGEQPGTRSVNSTGADGKSSKEKEVYTRPLDHPDVRAAMEELHSAPTLKQEYTQLMQGDPAVGNGPNGLPMSEAKPGFMDKWSQGIRDVQNKLGYAPNVIPTQEEMQLHAPGLVAEDMGHANRFGMPSLHSGLQMNVPRTATSDQNANLWNMMRGGGQPQAGSSTPPPTAAAPAPDQAPSGNMFYGPNPISIVPSR